MAKTKRSSTDIVLLENNVASVCVGRTRQRLAERDRRVVLKLQHDTTPQCSRHH